jgi:hypothetical protein
MFAAERAIFVLRPPPARLAQAFKPGNGSAQRSIGLTGESMPDRAKQAIETSGYRTRKGHRRRAGSRY